MNSETAVMSSIGTYLRDLRARRGISLEEIGRTTRVPMRYLEALETDAHDALPAAVFTRGFIRAYCQAIGQGPDDALALYDARDGRPAPAIPPGVAPVPRPGEGDPPGRGAVLVSFVLVLVLGVALFAVALVIQPRERTERFATESRPESAPMPPPTAEAPPAAPSPSPSPVAPAPVAAVRPASPPDAAPQPPPSGPPRSVPMPATAPATGAPPDLDSLAGMNSPYRLIVRASETTWIRVRTDDGRNSEESIPAGEVREWVSNRPFILTVGNAGGVMFELNGRALPPLGARGTVIPRLVLPPDTR